MTPKALLGQLPKTRTGDPAKDIASLHVALASILRKLDDNYSGQVVFPAIQNPSTDPNTLDDYVEGNWTPVLTFTTPGDVSVTYSEQVGRYTKIGRLVIVSCSITTSAFTHTTAAGSAVISGLPFTAENAGTQLFRGALTWQGITKANYTDISLAVVQNATTTRLQASGSGQVISNVSTADMPTGGAVILRGTAAYNV